MAYGLCLTAFVLGLTSLITQLLLVREFFNLFFGNELSVGLILSTWLLLTGLGSFVGAGAARLRRPLLYLAICQFFIGSFPPLAAALVRFCRSMLLPGSSFDLSQTLLSSLVLLAPYCLVSGASLALYSVVLSRYRRADEIGSVYFWDTLGSVIGGIAFSVFLVHHLKPFEVFSLLAVLNIISAGRIFAMEWTGRWSIRASAVFAAIFSALVVVLLPQLELPTAGLMFRGERVIKERFSPFGHIVVTRVHEQDNYYINSIPIGSSSDRAAAEEAVHFGLSFLEEPTVLLISGGLSGSLEEALKHKPSRIDYVELDPELLKLASDRLEGFSDATVRLIAADARSLVRSKRADYDAVLMSLPEPSSAMLNRYYTLEFFREVRRALRPGGVFAFRLGSSGNFAREELRLLLSAIRRSLENVFPHILIIPAENYVFLSSERRLDYSFTRRIEEKGIAVNYTGTAWLRGNFTPDRIAAAREIVSAASLPSTDSAPLSYYRTMQYWLSRVGGSLLLPFVFGFLLMLMPASVICASARPVVTSALAASGFSAMGIEVLAVMAFQIFYGYVYLEISMLITAFLAGSALGAVLAKREHGDTASRLLECDVLLSLVALALLSLLSAGLFGPEGGQPPPAIVFSGLVFLAGLFSGAQFPLAARMLSGDSVEAVGKSAARLFAADHLGASLGAFAVASFAVPLLGMPVTCMALAALKFATALMLAGARRKEHGSKRISTRALVPLLVSALALLLFVTLGTAVSGEESLQSIYAWTFSEHYHFLITVFLAWGLLKAFSLTGKDKEAGKSTKADTKSETGPPRSSRLRLDAFRLLSYAVFAPVAFLPLFRCYFSVPFLFCHVCPRKCVFGFLRPYLIPGALIMNLERRFWCARSCPIGTLSDCQGRFRDRTRRLPLVLRSLAWAALVFTVVAYFKVRRDQAVELPLRQDWYAFFFEGQYAVQPEVIAAAAAVLILALLIRRPFCETLCPVGAFSNLLGRIERGLFPTASSPMTKNREAEYE